MLPQHKDENIIIRNVTVQWNNEKKKFGQLKGGRSQAVHSDIAYVIQQRLCLVSAQVIPLYVENYKNAAFIS